MKNIFIRTSLLIAVIVLIIIPNSLILKNSSSSNKSLSQNSSDKKILEEYEQSETVFFNNKEYIKLNVAELYILLSRKSEEFKNKNFVLRGLAFKNEDLEKKSEIALLRMMVNCCFADAVPYFVKLIPTPEYVYNEYEWLNVYGSVEIEDEKNPAGSFRLIAEKIEIIPENTVEKHQVYIFEVRQQAPFAY